MHAARRHSRRARADVRGAFPGRIALHVALIGATGCRMAWRERAYASRSERRMRAAERSAIEAVNSIPLQHHGPENPLANDTDSRGAADAGQAGGAGQEREKLPPDAVPLKSQKAKKRPAEVASERQRFRPFKELEHNQVTTQAGAAGIESAVFGDAGRGPRRARAPTPRWATVSPATRSRSSSWSRRIGAPATWTRAFKPRPW